MKFTYDTKIIEDGKEDVYLKIGNKTLTIEKELYESMGRTYEEMQTRNGLAGLLLDISTIIMRAELFVK